MSKVYAIIFVILIGLSISSFSYCENVNIEDLVDQYKHATDLQRQELEKNYIGKKAIGSGTVDNVGEYDFFDITNDTGGKYYKVLIHQQETANKVPYQIVMLYKDKNRVKEINKGERVEKEGNIMKIIDERLQIAVWIYDGELTSKELDLFK